MAGTITTLRVRVFGSGRCLRFDREHACYTLRPFSELLLRELRDIADAQHWPAAVKDRKARTAFHLAGF